MGLDEFVGKFILGFVVFCIVLILGCIYFPEISKKIKIQRLEKRRENESIIRQEAHERLQETYGEYPDIKKKWRNNPMYKDIYDAVDRKIGLEIDKVKSNVKYVEQSGGKPTIGRIEIEMNGREMMLYEDAYERPYAEYIFSEKIYSFGENYSITKEQQYALLRVIKEDLAKKYPGIKFEFIRSDYSINGIKFDGLFIDLNNYLVCKKVMNILDD